MECMWSKKRIMEMYLNIVEFGKGVYGIEKAAQKFYRKPAAKLNRFEASMLTTVLPSPSKRNPSNPSGYMYSYQQRVLWSMSSIISIDFDGSNDDRRNSRK
jgi:monofunctional biosynthetic peptidoglycan transglycosylase